jgi:polar amino acid transport system permease protein
MERRRHLAWETGIALLLLIAVSAGCYAVFQNLTYKTNWDAPRQDAPLLWSGWLATLRISAGALILGCLLALGLVAAQLSPFKSLRMAAQAYVELVRGTPFLVQLLLGYYVLAPAVGLDHKPTAAVLLLAIFESAYLAEILRGGVASIEKPQWEAASALGFTTSQTWRYIILPQAIRRILPGLTGQSASLIKDSSLLMVIGVQEFAFQAEQTARNHAAPLEAYIPMALGYVALTLPLSLLSRRLEHAWKAA